MPVVSIDYASDEFPVEGQDRNVDTDWLDDRRASLRRPFTRYEPRHRADCPSEPAQLGFVASAAHRG